MWAAQLSDDRFLPEIEKRLKELDGKSTRPPLAGHTREIKAIYMLANQIRLLMRALGAGEVEFIDGPEGPADRLKARKKAKGMAKIAEVLGN